ncbi:MAG TPA: spermine synthase [Vicingus sp.]|nr:spermine synthase [Vicingus sp.]
MIKKIISFIYPLTRKIESVHNGILELTQLNGKVYLDTANTNYSYGSLQKILKFSLLQVDLSKAKNILVLGLGGGSVLKTIRKDFNYAGNITAVDFDPVIIDIAEKEFGITNDEKTTIICSDAVDFIRNTNDSFNLIIIDLFIDNEIPKKILLPEFWKEIIKNTALDGYIIFNTLCKPFTDIKPIEDKLRKRGLDYKIFRYVENTNKVLIANCKPH